MVLLIGRPIVGAPGAAVSTSDTVDQMVVSVGPYMLRTSCAAARSWSASDSLSASPPVITTRTLRSDSGVMPTSACHRLGVACMTDVRLDTISSPSTTGSRTVSRSATISFAPATSGTKISRLEMSKPNVVTASSRSALVIESRWHMSVIRLASASCGMTTPLGLPVDPEVYMTYAGLFGLRNPSRSASVTSTAPPRLRSARSASAPPSTKLGVPPSSGSLARADSSVITSTGLASVNMYRTRSAGWSRSIGRYAAPDLSTASAATIRSALRVSAMATTRSGPAPLAISSRASRLARAVSCR